MSEPRTTNRGNTMEEKISNPKKYRELCQPFASVDEANDAIKAFWNEFYELRCKHRIPDAQLTVRIDVVNSQGEEGEVMLLMHAGSELQEEPMAAWAFGQAQARRQESVTRMLSESKAIKRTVNKK